MEIRIAGVVPESIVDGPGYRYAIFVQGCVHACPGCHNPQSHDLLGGTLTDTQEIIAGIGKNPLVRGVTLSGGEPMLQAAALLEIASAAKQKGLSVWCYTGYTLEHLLRERHPDRMALLALVDVLVDGPYIAHERSIDLLYCGSRNQRLIDMKKTLERGETVLFVPAQW